MSEFIINAITSKMSTFLAEHNFKKGENGRYSNEKLDFELEYNQNTSHLVLNIGAAEAETLQKVSEWMCTDESVEYDGGLIADDFIEVISKQLGIKKSSLTFKGAVNIPVKDKSGSEMTIDGFTAKVLNAFPEYKELYKQEVAAAGEYLYVDFMKKTVVAKLRELVKSPEQNLKTIEKVIRLCSEAYYDGMAEVSDLAVGFVIPAIFYDCPDVFDKCSEALKENRPLFITAGKTTIEQAAKNKKFIEIIK